MKKIMFNDKYGLTQAVLENRKTQTRRIISPKAIDKAEQYQVDYYNDTLDGITLEDILVNANHIMGVPPLSLYHIGEEVAIAQKYRECNRAVCLVDTAGWNNKMFVLANLMPHRIRITKIRVERLQDIIDEDCMKEGVKLHKGRFLIENLKGVEFYTNSARLAFKYLINKLSGKHTWDSNPYVFVYDFKLIK